MKSRFDLYDPDELYTRDSECPTRIPLDVFTLVFSMMLDADYIEWKRVWEEDLPESKQIVDDIWPNIYVGLIHMDEKYKACSDLPIDVFRQRLADYSQPPEVYSWLYNRDYKSF